MIEAQAPDAAERIGLGKDEIWIGLQHRV
jgi:hypothetical protein